MLKNVDPLLSASLLGHLAAMGHGDVLALVDRNFPASSTARRLVELPGTDVATAARAILTVFPLDTFVEPALAHMAPVDAPSSVLEVHEKVQAIASEAEGRPLVTAPVERFAFYERAEQAYLVVATTEDRRFGCFLLTKGVV